MRRMRQTRGKARRGSTATRLECSCELGRYIVAIATPPGRGGIGVVRLAGPEARAIAAPCSASVVKLEPGRAVRGDLVEPGGAGDDVAKLGRHQDLRAHWRSRGYLLCQAALLHHRRRCRDLGARLAGGAAAHRRTRSCGGCASCEPGEFTMRAFLNGRLDLTQAEAVRDLIDSQTLFQAKVAAQQLEGASLIA